MADTTQVPMNGTFPAQPAYPDFNPAQATMNNAAAFQQTQSSTPSNVPPAGDMKNGLSKDEVGWYFVEQYYTNMSRCPDKLHHFYSRRSQFVFGAEAEPVPVAVGQKAINDKIKQLDFQECKVRVLNVDSQASFENILITVIGEISNKSEPSRKFVQTFVLAEQPNGYYVLNDIFRYLTEEDEEISHEEPASTAEPKEAPEVPEAPAEPAEPAAPEVAAAAEPTDAQVDNEPAAHKVDEKLEEAQPNGETTATQPQVAEQTNGETEAQEALEVPAAVAGTESTQTEYPPSPETTPTPAEPKEPPASKEDTTPASAPTPAKAVPKTWANIASKSSATAPVVPAIPVARSKAPASNSSQPAVPAPAQPAAAATTDAVPAAPAESTLSQPASNDNSGWQTAGPDHKKTQSRAGDEQNVLAYIKNVNDKVDASVLRQTLSRFGKLKYFDVSRQKNCAFVEFAEPAGYAAAVAANPHQIGSEQITVEERRPRSNAYGNNTGFGPGRGGAGRGRGDRAGSQGRGGFQRDGRGGFAPRGRGGNPGPKGRSQAQAA